jgi:exosortase D (VPLPA-CTERM-specific)
MANRSLWRWGILLAAIVALYAEILYRLGSHWNADPNFSHGWLVPPFSFYVVWQMRQRLWNTPPSPHWFGLLVVVGALAQMVVGVLGAELFLSRTSLLFLLAGMIIFFWGWRHLRMLLFPWAFLFLMVPIPKIIFNQIAFPLQMFASKLATAQLELFNVPVLREGNVIQLPGMALEVVEACSGIRSLMSLVTLALIYGFFLESSLWRRALLALGAVPIAVFANAFRVTGTGLLGQYWDPDKAMGFFHDFSGWIIFVVSMFLLFGLHGLIRTVEKWFSKRTPKTVTTTTDGPVEISVAAQERMTLTPAVLRLLVVLVVLGVTAPMIYAGRGEENLPPHLPVSEFPRQIGAWTQSKDYPMDEEVRAVLGDGDFLQRIYSATDRPFVDFFLAYFPTQRTGSTIHSPLNCIPGAGWAPIDHSRIQIPRGQTLVTVNRYVIAKGDERQMVLYWYQSNGRVVASEYWAKLYLVADSIRLHRSDGALIRVITPVLRSEDLKKSEARAAEFATEVLQKLDPFIPR